VQKPHQQYDLGADTCLEIVEAGWVLDFELSRVKLVELQGDLYVDLGSDKVLDSISIPLLPLHSTTIL
jgi:hypothetical protein